MRARAKVRLVGSQLRRVRLRVLEVHLIYDRESKHGERAKIEPRVQARDAKEHGGRYPFAPPEALGHGVECQGANDPESCTTDDDRAQGADEDRAETLEPERVAVGGANG